MAGGKITDARESAALWEIVQGVEAESGDRFFSSLVRHLATVLDCQYAFVSNLSTDRRRFRTLAVWGRGAFLDNFELPVAGTPCEAVLQGQISHHPEKLRELFPEDEGLALWNAESYSGVPLLDASGTVTGHLAIFADQPMRDGPRGVAIMRIFAMRARMEIERSRIEAALRESESRYRDLYDSAPSPILTLDTEGRIIACNRRFLLWAGISEGDLHRYSYVDFSVPEAIKRRRELHAIVMGGGEIEEEIQVRPPSGQQQHWIRLAQRPVRDPQGKVIAAQAVFTDITDRKKAEEALRSSEERFERVLGSAMDAIVTFDESLNIELFNEAAEKTFACKSAEVLGKPLNRFLTDRLAGALQRAMSTNEPVPYAALLAPVGMSARRSSGEEFAIEATLSRVKVQERQLFTLILRDVDELRRAEEERRNLVLQNEYLQEEVKSVLNFDEIVGQSRALAETLDNVRLVAQTDSTVLILGETGTGKELIARAVHSNSARRERPLIKVNCAALPSGLIESELFGHEKGAFTGASEKRVGRFELAHGGTIFLDEIGEIPSELQVKLLRVLQEHEIERVGGRDTIRVDVRVVAGTNRDLQAAVEGGAFRSDLYYRLNVFPLRVPPLRERAEDIPLLVHYFVQRYAGKIGRKITRVPKATMARLISYRWPGNVRELENVIERAVILSPGPELKIVPELLPTSDAGQNFEGAAMDRRRVERPSDADAGDMSLTGVERTHILTALKRSHWKLEGPDGAAKALKLNPSTLRSRIKKLGITRDI
jgi:PAS domain S-box-containing protein